MCFIRTLPPLYMGKIDPPTCKSPVSIPKSFVNSIQFYSKIFIQFFFKSYFVQKISLTITIDLYPVFLYHVSYLKKRCTQTPCIGYKRSNLKEEI